MAKRSDLINETDSEITSDCEAPVRAIEELQMSFAILYYLLRPSRVSDLILELQDKFKKQESGKVSLNSAERITLMLIDIVKHANFDKCQRPEVIKLYLWKIPDGENTIEKTAFEKLESTGLIMQGKDRSASAKNRNANLIQLTEAGRNILKKLSEERASSIELLLKLLEKKGITATQVVEFLKDLKNEGLKLMFEESEKASKQRKSASLRRVRTPKQNDKPRRGGHAGECSN